MDSRPSAPGPGGHVATRWDDQPFVTPPAIIRRSRPPLDLSLERRGRLRANIERHPRVAAEISDWPSPAIEHCTGILAPVRSAIVFGEVRILREPGEQRQALHTHRQVLPSMEVGSDYRPATDDELKRTTVYAVQIESWSGKENWKEQADQSAEWPALDRHLLEADSL